MTDGKLYDPDHQMSDGGDTRMTAAEEVLAYLLVEVVGAPDDVPYSPNQAQLILETKLKESQKIAAAAKWRPISEADRGVAYFHDFGGTRIGNCYPIWARDADGRVFECLWADDGKRAYWWDIEGESPVDPVEFMPHPLATA